DIIAIDRIVLHHRRLTLPHPRAHLRDFVLIPLREIDPSTAQWIETTDTSR
ncbi:MAG: 2-amino-4-hydroxy-6-hydroxymethyldihydropteridine diphosphokinase, partial [Duncaniella sp.]|nr:2-amino-4-hydroxy-6-hydroxymethyldihydropteridine diphosphokinase [Duncaniella sp.]